MTKRLRCPPAPGPPEGYVARFDQVFASLAQRRGFRDYLAGLLLDSNRNKTLAALADTEPVLGAQHREAQRLQFFLTESVWDHQAVNDVRLRLLLDYQGRLLLQLSCCMRIPVPVGGIGYEKKASSA